MGSMFYHVLEKSKEKFKEKDFSLLKDFIPDELRANYWKNKLSNLTRKPKVGFCWRSGLITPDRENIQLWTNGNFHSREFSFVSLNMT